MKKAWIASLLALLLSLPVAAAAAVPQTLNFSARIADNGRPVTGSHTVKFAFWDCDGSDPLTCVDPANVLWSETQTLTVSDGVVSAVLGADTTTPNPLPLTIFNGAPLFLEVTFDGTAFSPRMTLHSVPYALQAGNVPRIATSSTTLSSTITAACTNHLSVSIVAPQAGNVLVTTTAWVEHSHVTGVADADYISLGTSATDCFSDSNRQFAYSASGLPSGFTVVPMNLHRVFPVPGPGTYTFYLNGIAAQGDGSGTDRFFQSRITAVFYAN